MSAHWHENAAADEWTAHFEHCRGKKYQIIAGPSMESFATSISEREPARFMYQPTIWKKFDDGTDYIEIGGFHPINRISGQHVLMIASFHNNDVTLSQFSVMICLLQSFISSLTVVLPFYPVGTMERVLKEGVVATANTYAQLFSNLPSCGKPTRLMVYDIHALQNRFYLHGNTTASLHSAVPLLLSALRATSITCVAFPDDGAAKRFGSHFSSIGMEIITCGKTRTDNHRRVVIQDGNPSGQHIVIVDDLVQSGSTLYECYGALKRAGAISVCAFVTHAVFPHQCWRRFLRGGDRHCFEKFWVTNSIPTTTQHLPTDDVFEVFDLSVTVVQDLDSFF
jgi:phosphoribosylpyrophosphate synthetase